MRHIDYVSKGNPARFNFEDQEAAQQAWIEIHSWSPFPSEIEVFEDGDPNKYGSGAQPVGQFEGV